MKREFVPFALAGAVALAGLPRRRRRRISPSALPHSRMAVGSRRRTPATIRRIRTASATNVSPPLAWSNVPAKATSLALLMFDPEGRGGQGVSHWVAYGIPVSVTGFAEGEASKPSEKFVGGISTMKESVYFGPCTPPGPLHHYTFTLIATTHGVKDLPPGLTREEFFEKSEGKLLTATGLVGLWKKK